MSGINIDNKPSLSNSIQLAPDIDFSEVYTNQSRSRQETTIAQLLKQKYNLSVDDQTKSDGRITEGRVNVEFYIPVDVRVIDAIAEMRDSFVTGHLRPSDLISARSFHFLEELPSVSTEDASQVRRVQFELNFNLSATEFVQRQYAESNLLRITPFENLTLGCMLTYLATGEDITHEYSFRSLVAPLDDNRTPGRFLQFHYRGGYGVSDESRISSLCGVRAAFSSR